MTNNEELDNNSVDAYLKKEVETYLSTHLYRGFSQHFKMLALARIVDVPGNEYVVCLNLDDEEIRLVELDTGWHSGFRAIGKRFGIRLCLERRLFSDF